MKIKKLLPLVFAAISVSSFGGTHDLQTNLSEINGKIITDRGRSQFRESVMFKKMDRRGYSGSSQYIEGIGKIKSSYDKYDNNTDYDAKIKGFLMATNSTFLSNPDFMTGMSFGYIRSRAEFDDQDDSSQKIRTYGLNTYLAYNKENWLFIGRAGYDESKNILKTTNISNIVYRTKNYSLGAEGGYFFELGEKSLLYPYLGVGWNQYTTKGHDGISTSNDRVGSGNVGLMYSKEMGDKFLFTGNAEWSYEFADRKKFITDSGKIKALEVSRDTGMFSLGLGYYIDPDFLVNVKYQGYVNKNYYYDMVILSFIHNF
ncbi:autotransporter outer membrane beta-barrel domain-containing protein [Fusobacterium ulcerans]|jgi:outer membrane autotransporter protein|uniref:autotransporter outer membrane beta-barrel domain-containing protein n=1 Tax=Fusobacterium ulcerans TaxID=861 RepID=UPI000E49A298|nr:autotransporter outer membrane beta-barrel domain-containing protein [Fusobacterium ulcerans]RGY67094.1 autotransporter outer membrane beta-barrel domain-containing protein [Fusobacterium ulcerans]